MTPNSLLLKRLTSNLKTIATQLSVVSTASAVALAVPASFLALSAVSMPAIAANPDYFACTAGMTASGVTEADAIAACAGARYPEALGTCVVDVSELTGLTATAALLVCERSRRPTEVANCTIDIHKALLDSPSTQVLENCGRSLLPERYGSCVVDMVEATEVAVDDALNQCIRAGYRPWTLEPRS